MSWGATILDAEGLRLSPDEKAFFRDVRPFGFILFARNLESPGQIRALCEEMRECTGHRAPILIDQEGGRVQRLLPPLARLWRPPLEQAQAAGDGAARAMYLRYRLIAEELRGLGIDANCAPMVDIAGPQTHAFLRNRCYGETARDVSELGRAVAEGLLEGGVLPVLKHIPGHGRATQDSHFDLPHVDATAEELANTDFAPFRALADLPMAMTAHVVYSAIDAAPATVSAKVIGLIREQIGIQGLLMTDDISMKALKGSLAELSRAALDAGCDVILHCNGTLAERIEVAEAAGRLTPRAQARAEAALAARQEPHPLDTSAAEAELSRLMQGHVHG